MNTLRRIAVLVPLTAGDATTANAYLTGPLSC
jgi:hypothetical protein